MEAMLLAVGKSIVCALHGRFSGRKIAIGKLKRNGRSHILNQYTHTICNLLNIIRCVAIDILSTLCRVVWISCAINSVRAISIGSQMLRQSTCIHHTHTDDDDDTRRKSLRMLQTCLPSLARLSFLSLFLSLFWLSFSSLYYCVKFRTLVASIRFYDSEHRMNIEIAYVIFV